MAKEHPGGGKLITKQSDGDGTDINDIMHRYIVHGDTPPGMGTLKYGDFTNVDGYHAALNKINEAQKQFERLPAFVKRHVDHDPGKFLEMVFDPDRRGELEELGLIPERAPKDAPEATPPEPITPAEPLPPTE